MRTVHSFLAAALLALSAFALACSGDDDQPQAQQPQAQQVQQAQAQQAQQTQPAAALAEQATQQQAEQTAVVQQQDGAEQAEHASSSSDPLLDEAFAAFTAWSEGLESMTLDFETDFSIDGSTAQMSGSIAADLEPLTILATVDATEMLLMASAGEDVVDSVGDFMPMTILTTADGMFLSLPALDGWIDLTNEAGGIEGIAGMLGGDPNELIDPDQIGMAFGCVEAAGGSVTFGSQAGESAWIVDCMIDLDTINEASAAALQEQGLDLTEGGIESMHLRLAISQASGAPLLIETRMTMSDPLALLDDESDQQAAAESYIATTTYLISWNEPIDFPAPEPIVDGSMLDLFAGDDAFEDTASLNGSDASDPALSSAAGLLDQTVAWAMALDEMHLRFSAQAVIDGEVVRASGNLRGSQRQGMFETDVTIDDGSTLRLHWNRDGIWSGDADVNGEPVWTLSTPSLLGFGGISVDEYLAEPDRLNLRSLYALRDIASVTSTQSGGAAMVHELGFEGADLMYGDWRFDLIADLLKSEAAIFLADSVVVERVDSYSVVITLQGDDGEFVSRATEAEFMTSAGRVELSARVELIEGGPLVFSSPAN